MPRPTADESDRFSRPSARARSRAGRLAVLLSAIMAAASGGATLAESGRDAGSEPRALTLDGEVVDPVSASRGAWSVFIFAAADCPISNRYAPEISRIGERYSARGIRFHIVYPGAHVTTHAAREHGTEYGLDLPALIDPELELAERLGMSVTPEVAVLSPEGAVVYRGRIDDRYVAFGRVRPAPRRRDLVEVLDGILAGETPEPRTTAAVGCFIRGAGRR